MAGYASNIEELFDDMPAVNRGEGVADNSHLSRTIKDLLGVLFNILKVSVSQKAQSSLPHRLLELYSSDRAV